MADNLISASLVLADGSSATVSYDRHPDLFWALRGAGHNFGIVTDFDYKVYDITAENAVWSYEQLYYSLDKIEDVLEVVNDMVGRVDQPAPVELTVFGLISRFPGVADGDVCCIVRSIYSLPLC
jgi:FAD/FMN-containing dehydrogenase